MSFTFFLWRSFIIFTRKFSFDGVEKCACSFPSSWKFIKIWINWKLSWEIVIHYDLSYQMIQQELFQLHCLLHLEFLCFPAYFLLGQCLTVSVAEAINLNSKKEINIILTLITVFCEVLIPWICCSIASFFLSPSSIAFSAISAPASTSESCLRLQRLLDNSRLSPGFRWSDTFLLVGLFPARDRVWLDSKGLKKEWVSFIRNSGILTCLQQSLAVLGLKLQWRHLWTGTI